MIRVIIFGFHAKLQGDRHNEIVARDCRMPIIRTDAGAHNWYLQAGYRQIGGQKSRINVTGLDLGDEYHDKAQTANERQAFAEFGECLKQNRW